MATIRTCIVDRKQYNYCPKCGSDNPNEKWRFLYCSEKCKTIYNITKDFNSKKITSTEANNLLSSLGYIDTNKLTDGVKDVVTTIMNNNVEQTTYVSRKKNKKNRYDDNKDVIKEEIVNDIITEENKTEDIALPESNIEDVSISDDFSIDSMF